MSKAKNNSIFLEESHSELKFIVNDYDRSDYYYSYIKKSANDVIGPGNKK